MHGIQTIGLYTNMHSESVKIVICYPFQIFIFSLILITKKIESLMGCFQEHASRVAGVISIDFRMLLHLDYI